MIRKVLLLGSAGLVAIGVLACHERGHSIGDLYLTHPPHQATAEIRSTTGNTAAGTVTFTQVDGGVRVVADLRGLSAGRHGWHVHEGNCDAPDATSALGHYNPTGAPHAGPDDAAHHVGDLGNIEADAQGLAHLDRVYAGLSLDGPNKIVGHAVILHAGTDDLSSQPAGNSGARVGCGMIVER